MNMQTKKYFTENKQYETVLHSDVLLPCRFAKRSTTGLADDLVQHIEKTQLLDVSLWKRFVRQFRDATDREDDGWRGEYWGKMMRGAGITYLYTQNEELYDVLTETVLDLLTTQDALGRFSSYTVETEFSGWDVWSRKYILLGLLHYHEICKDTALKDRIVEALKKHLDYIMDKVGEGKKPMNETSIYWGGANSLSILEPVVRLYNLTGEKKYFDYATYLVNHSTKDFDIFAAAMENILPPYKWGHTKAYEITSCFEGLLEYYRVTKEEKYKQAAINFAKQVMDTDVTIIGDCGCEHEFFDHSTVTQTDITKKREMQEHCVTVTWMKFCYQLLRLTGDSVYADELEKSFYNAMAGAVNTKNCTSDNGFPFDSYSPLWLYKRGRASGGVKRDENGVPVYGCCAAIGAAGTGIVPEIALSCTEKGIAFSLYLDGTYSIVSPSGKEFDIKLSTLYPADGNVNFEILSDVDEAFEIKLRNPAFSRNTTVAVNGENAVASKGYITLERAWKKGDKIALSIDMCPRVILPVTDEESGVRNFIAVNYGPLCLARDSAIHANAGQPVELDYDSDLNICLEVIGKTDYALCAFKVPCKDGSYIDMIDYQSAGKDWESPIEAWMPTK